MQFSKSWIDEDDHVWFAVNMSIGEHRDDHIAREFSYAFLKAASSLSLFEEMLLFLGKFYQQFVWDTTNNILTVIQKKSSHYSVGLIGKKDEEEMIKVSVIVERYIVTNILIDLKTKKHINS